MISNFVNQPRRYHLVLNYRLESVEQSFPLGIKFQWNRDSVLVLLIDVCSFIVFSNILIQEVHQDEPPFLIEYLNRIKGEF